MTLPDMRLRLTASDAAAREALRRARAEVRGLGSDARTAATGTTRLRQSTEAGTQTNRRFSYQVQNAAFQVGDFAVQVNGGTSAVRAMSQQMPQLLGSFGIFGAVAGAAFAILAPLVGKLFEGAEAVGAFDDELKASNVTLGSIRGSVSGLHETYTRMNNAIRASASASGGAASAIVANSEAEYKARRQVLGVEIELLNIRQGEMRSQLQNLRDQQALAAQRAKENLRTLGPGATASRSADAEGYAGGALDYDTMLLGSGLDLHQMAGNRRAIRRMEAELELLTIAANEASAAMDGVFTAPGTTDAVTGGGAGGRGKTPVETAIESQKSAIQDLVAATRGGLSEASGAWGSYFDDLVSRSGSSNSKMLAIAKSFGAATALIDAWQAHNAVLKDPTLPWWARIATAGTVLASGLGAVNAIRGVTAGGGGGGRKGGGGSSGSEVAAAPRPLQATLNLQGPLADVLSSAISPLLDQLSEEAGDRGYQLLVRPATT